MTRLSYLVCGTPRSGTSLLCEGLRATGVAGRPEEYFWRDDEPFWRERWHVHTYEDYVAAALREGTTPNGVFGAKIMWVYLVDDFAPKLRKFSGKAQLSVADLLRPMRAIYEARLQFRDRPGANCAHENSEETAHDRKPRPDDREGDLY